MKQRANFKKAENQIEDEYSNIKVERLDIEHLFGLNYDDKD